MGSLVCSGEVRRRRGSSAVVMMALALAVAACGGGGKGSANRGAAFAGPFAEGVASGEVEPTAAVLWTRVGEAAAVTVEIAADPLFANPMRQDAAATADQNFVVKVAVAGLSPATSYYYRFTGVGVTSAVGTFHTPPLAATAVPVRFTWAGDTDATQGLNHFEALDHARAESPDFFVYLGDTVYQDSPPAATTLAAMRARYQLTRSYPALTDLLAATSTYAIWDDHEVQNNFAPGSVDPGLLAAGRQAFSEYFPLAPQGQNPGFFRTFRWGKALELFILDERSFRSTEVDAACGGDQAPLLPAAQRAQLGLTAAVPATCAPALADPSRTMLGADQKQQLLAALKASDATWKVIVNEVAISQLYVLPFDRWEGYAAERAELLDFIRANALTNVVFVTGDLHASVASDVAVDGQTDPTPIAKEFIVGPVGYKPLRPELASAVGQAKADSVVATLRAMAPMQCLDGDHYAYGLAEIDPAAGTMTVTLKSDQGVALCPPVVMTAAP